MVETATGGAIGQRADPRYVFPGPDACRPMLRRPIGRSGPRPPRSCRPGRGGRGWPHRRLPPRTPARRALAAPPRGRRITTRPRRRRATLPAPAVGSGPRAATPGSWPPPRRAPPVSSAGTRPGPDRPTCRASPALWPRSASSPRGLNNADERIPTRRFGTPISVRTPKTTRASYTVSG